MDRIVSKRHFAAIFYTTGFFLCLAALLLFPSAVQANAASGIQYCLSVLVPSLFPFMALSSFAVNSPAAQALGAPLGPVARKVFRLPSCCALPILMSLIGGYPAGARGVSLLLEKGQITPSQAGRMMLFCVNPGLAFVVSFLGAGVLGSTRLGWLMFLSVSLSGLTLGVLTAIPASPPKEETLVDAGSHAGALMRSVTDASRSVLVMSACVVLFSVLTAVLHSCGAFQQAVRLLSRTGLFSPMEWSVLLSFVIEVTGGVGDAAWLSAAPAFYAFGLAFGGLCVHMQVLAFFPRPPVKLRYFWLARLAHGLLSVGCFLLFCRLLPPNALPTAAPVAAGAVQAFSGSFLGGASLLLMCAAFLLSTQESAPVEWHIGRKEKAHPEA